MSKKKIEHIELPHHLGIHSKDTWPEVFIGPEGKVYKAVREAVIQEAIALAETMLKERINLHGVRAPCWSAVTLENIIARLEALRGK